MNESQSFAPSVIIDGRIVIPEGWMWVLGLALGGCQWAIRQCADPEYDLRGKMLDYEQRRNEYFTKQKIERLEAELALLKKSLVGN